MRGASAPGSASARHCNVTRQPGRIADCGRWRARRATFVRRHGLRNQRARDPFQFLIHVLSLTRRSLRPFRAGRAIGSLRFTSRVAARLRRATARQASASLVRSAARTSRIFRAPRARQVSAQANGHSFLHNEACCLMKGVGATFGVMRQASGSHSDAGQNSF